MTNKTINELRKEFIEADEEALLKTAVVSAYMGLSIPWFNNKAVSGGGIPFTKIGRARMYAKKDVLEWMQVHLKKVSSTSEYKEV